MAEEWVAHSNRTGVEVHRSHYHSSHEEEVEVMVELVIVDRLRHT